MKFYLIVAKGSKKAVAPKKKESGGWFDWF